MIDVHIHLQAGWNEDAVKRSVALCNIDKGILAAAPLDHWGSDLTAGCAQVIKMFPEKFVGLVGVHPPDVAQSLRDIERYGKQGFVGIKLMPTSGYYPDDEAFGPIFEEVNARKWIVLTHCGWCSKGVKEKDLPQSTRFSDPYHIEPLARVFKDIDFILAHGGGRTYFPRAWELTHYHENVYIDTCPGQGPWALEHGGKWLEVLNWRQVLFGTDMLIGNLDAAKCYHEKEARIMKIMEQLGPQDRLKDVMHANAARLLAKHGVEV